MAISELVLVKYAIEMGLTLESGAIAFLGWQIYKSNKYFRELITAHDKRITILEVKQNG
ncbi:hypothetical protein K2C01_003868 [Vibrio vulnificus]|uniref:hypothetical protein n=1 Tax=Vibrio vulnificus TaxID=672 RepID=UPI0013EE57EE|nr:hypothetical protein [Vibrio vulnificus]EHY1015190.1 hypothetical protein [Vibrio vulnificus]HDY8229133.1 hypothetical protein [Vibrio vulnificus]